MRLKHSACNIVTNDQKDTHAAKPSSEAVDLRAYVYVALMVVLGSTTAAAAKFAVAELPVSLVPALRFGMAGLCLLPWVMGRGVLRRMIREDALLLLVTRSAMRSDQPGLLFERDSPWPDLARRNFLRDLPARGLVAGMVIENREAGPRAALGRAGERRGHCRDRYRQLLGRCERITR